MKKTHVFEVVPLGAVDLGLEDPNKALVMACFRNGCSGGETQKWGEAFLGQRVAEFDLLGGGDHAVEGSRGSDGGSDGQREYRRSGSAEHGIQGHFLHKYRE